MAVVEIEQLTKRFGRLNAVDGVSLSIQHGLFVSLLGPSGCGKTTLLRLVAGFLTPDEGSVKVGTRLISSPEKVLPPEQRNMSMIFQSYALWPHMTIAENVAYGLKLRRLPRSEVERRVSSILAVTRLSGLARSYPADISGGQQQRVALARALVVEPEILLLDEPLSNLDANLREEMRFEIRRLHDAYGYTTLYVTHDQVEAMTTADRIVVMNHGRIEQVGSPEEIYQRPCSEFVARFLGGTNILRGKRRGNALVDCGGIVLHCGAGEAGRGEEAIVSIRQHDIDLSAKIDGVPGNTPNEAAGTVAWRVYLGAQRDYLVSLKDGQQLRVLAPLAIDVPVGSAVRLRLPPEHCRMLPA
jgi:iron(III) transport system ATP-binding protein